MHWRTAIGTALVLALVVVVYVGLQDWAEQLQGEHEAARAAEAER